jgi:putative acetyltransferase
MDTRFEDADFEPTLSLWRSVTRATYTFLPTEMSHTAEEDRAYFRNVIAAKNEIWLAEEAGRLFGFLAGTDGYVDRLYVAVDRQRQGIGTSLLALAKEQWPTGLRLHTHQKNVGACHFYEEEGFEVARYGVSPPPESEPDVEYRWTP